MRAYAGKRARVLCVRLCVEWWLYRLPLSVERERERERERGVESIRREEACAVCVLGVVAEFLSREVGTNKCWGSTGEI